MGSSRWGARRRAMAALAAGSALAVVGSLTAQPAVAETGSVTAKPLPTRLAPVLAAHAKFGADVAVDGDTLVVGASNDRGPGKSSGSAAVYVATDDGWEEQARLVPLRPQNQARFGYSVAVDGDTAVVGAPYRDESDNYAGAAYVFTRTGTTWTEQAKLPLTTLAESSMAGWSVAVQGDLVVVGVPGAGHFAGAAEVFTRSGTTWTQQAVLEPDAGRDGFGTAVAIDGDTLVVGQSTISGKEQSAYVYVGSGASWTQQAVLEPADLMTGDFFAANVDLSGDIVVASAQRDAVDGVDYAGSAYVFERAGGTWTEQSKLTADVLYEWDSFGTSVAVDGDVIAVGSYYYGGTPMEVFNGAAYTFHRAGDEWTQQHLLIPRPGSAGHFGIAVDLAQQPSGGRTLAVGSSWEDPSGAAYVYEW